MSVTLAPEVVDPDDIEMLQDLVVAAVPDASRAAQELQSESMGGRHRRASTSARSASADAPDP